MMAESLHIIQSTENGSWKEHKEDIAGEKTVEQNTTMKRMGQDKCSHSLRLQRGAPKS